LLKIPKKTLINIILMYALTGLFIYLLIKVWNTMYTEIAISLVIIAILILTTGSIAKVKGIESIYKIAVISVYVGVMMILCYHILVKTGFLERFENYDELKEFINTTGGRSELIYVLAQFLQVTFIPIPSNFVVLVGDELFGPVKAFFLSMAGLLLGSLFAFFLGKSFGLRLITWIAGKEAVEKYQRIVKGRDKTILVLMFAFPMFPDDLLCMVAGLTNMGYFTFFFVMLFTRSLAIGGTILFKRGLLDFIPMHGWGIPVWILLFIGLAVLFVYAVKYGDKLEEFMLKIMSKVTGRDLIQEMYPEKESKEKKLKKKTIKENNDVLKQIEKIKDD